MAFEEFTKPRKNRKISKIAKCIKKFNLKCNLHYANEESKIGISSNLVSAIFGIRREFGHREHLSAEKPLVSNEWKLLISVSISFNEEVPLKPRKFRDGTLKSNGKAQRTNRNCYTEAKSKEVGHLNEHSVHLAGERLEK